jgi:hypothetical protein
MSVQSEPRVEKPICTHSKSMAFLISRVRGKSPNNQGLGLITLLLGAEAPPWASDALENQPEGDRSQMTDSRTHDVHDAMEVSA